MKKLKYFTKFLCLISFFSILFSSYLMADTIDRNIKDYLRDNLGNISGYQGGAVVNTSTGEIIGDYIKSSALASHKNKISAIITNIVREVSATSKKLHLHPVWFEIKLKHNYGKFFISVIENDIFLGTFYKNASPIPSMERNLRRAKDDIIRILNP